MRKAGRGSSQTLHSVLNAFPHSPGKEININSFKQFEIAIKDGCLIPSRAYPLVVSTTSNTQK